jgi:hypothetical protein
MEERSNGHKNLAENGKEGDNLEDINIDEMIILKEVLKKYDLAWEDGAEFFWVRTDTSAELL